MMYLAPVRAVSSQVCTTPAPSKATRHVTVILPEGAPHFAAQMVVEFFRAANTLIKNAAYEVDAHALSDWPGSDPKYWQRRLVIFLGNIEARWHFSRRESQHALQILRLAPGKILVGGAVFLLSGTRMEDSCPVSIHPNFRASTDEEGLVHTQSPTPRFCDNAKIQSAISILAVLDILLGHVGKTHGDYISTALATYLGLDDGQEAARSKLSLEYRRRAAGDRVVSQTLDRMESNLSDPQSVDDMAQALNVSPRQLQRRFMGVLAAPPLAVYKTLRIERAHQLLTQTSLPLAEVSFLTGFGSPTYLTRCFKSIYQLTPVELRRAAFGAAGTPTRDRFDAPAPDAAQLLGRTRAALLSAKAARRARAAGCVLTTPATTASA